MRISVWSSNVCSSDLSKGEPLSGQLAVANVIMNRVESGRFPSTICGVVTQRDQFSFVRGGKIPAIDTNRKAYRTAMAVAQVAMADDWRVRAAGWSATATTVSSRSRSPSWNATRSEQHKSELQ